MRRDAPPGEDRPAPEVEGEIRRLREELADAKAALPAHTVRPNQWMRIEELEERIAELERLRTDPAPK